MKYATPLNESSILASKNTSASTQRKQIITLLNQFGSMNTPEFRQRGIMAPAPRIFELRKMGYSIDTIREDFTDHTEKVHKGVARYYLRTYTTKSPLAFEDAA